MQSEVQAILFDASGESQLRPIEKVENEIEVGGKSYIHAGNDIVHEPVIEEDGSFGGLRTKQTPVYVEKAEEKEA